MLKLGHIYVFLPLNIVQLIYNRAGASDSVRVLSVVEFHNSSTISIVPFKHDNSIL